MARKLTGDLWNRIQETAISALMLDGTINYNFAVLKALEIHKVSVDDYNKMGEMYGHFDEADGY